MVVGTKIDLRKDQEQVDKLKATGRDPVSEDQGKELAAVIGAHKYQECSALTQEGLSKVFEEAVKLVLYPKPAPQEDKAKRNECLVQ